MQAGPAAAGPLLRDPLTAALRHPAPAWEGPSRLLVQEGSWCATARLKAYGVHTGAEAGAGWGAGAARRTPLKDGLRGDAGPCLAEGTAGCAGGGHPEAQRTRPGRRSGRWA